MEKLRSWEAKIYSFLPSFVFKSLQCTEAPKPEWGGTPIGLHRHSWEAEWMQSCLIDAI